MIQSGLRENNAPARGERGSGRVGAWLVLLLALGLAGWWLFGRATRTQARNDGHGRGRGGDMVVPVVVAAAQSGDLPVFYSGLGTVTAYNTVTVRSRVDGQIVKVAYREGQFVTNGDLLLELDSRPFQVQLEQAQGQLARDQAALHDAKINYDRYVNLFQAGVIPQQQRDTQQALVEQYDGAIKTDQAQIDNARLQITYCHITAPISGRVGLGLVDLGNIVHASDTNGLLVITQLQPIAVLFSLPEDQLQSVYGKLRAGAELPVEAYDRDNSTRIAAGKLLTIDNQIDATTGTYRLKAIFPNADHALFPNQFVNVHLLVDQKRGLTIVPAPAIQRGPQGAYVYVVSKDAEKGNVVRLRTVTLAITESGVTGLSDGLHPGDVVVTDGQDKLQDGSRVDPQFASGGTAAPAGVAPGAPPAGRGGAAGSRR